MDRGLNYDLLEQNADFRYDNISKDEIEMIYDINMIRIKFKDGSKI